MSKHRRSSHRPGALASGEKVRRLTDDTDLWRVFTGEDAPPPATTSKPSPPDTRPREDFRTLLEQSDLDEQLSEAIREKRQGLEDHPPVAATDRLRDYPPPEADLDLHGCTGREAESATDAFLADAQRRGLKTVRIIVGKGLHTPDRPVLPDVIERRLATLRRQGMVLTFRWEKMRKRKSGAVHVFLLPGRP